MASRSLPVGATTDGVVTATTRRENEGQSFRGWLWAPSAGWTLSGTSRPNPASPASAGSPDMKRLLVAASSIVALIVSAPLVVHAAPLPRPLKANHENGSPRTPARGAHAARPRRRQRLDPAPRHPHPRRPHRPHPPPATPAPAPSANRPKTIYGHRGKFNLRAEFLTGYQMLFRYDKSPRCAPYNYEKSASDQQKFCGFGAAPALGLALGFSLVDFFEPFVFMPVWASERRPIRPTRAN